MERNAASDAPDGAVSRRRFLYGAGAVAGGFIAFGATACGSDSSPSTSNSGAPSGVSGPGQPTAINVGAIPPFAAVTWPLLVAAKEGYFAEAKVEPATTYTFGAAPLLAGGQVDLIHDGADSGLNAALGGKDIIFVATIGMTATIGILGAKGVTQPKDFEGKIFAVSAIGSTDEFLVRRFLEAKGVDVTKVEFLGVEDEGGALVQLQAGQIGGGKFTSGFMTKAGDLPVIATPKDLGTFPWNVVQTTRSYASGHGEALTAYLKALSRAVTFMGDTNNRAKVIEAVLSGDDTLERPFVEAIYDVELGQYKIFDFGSVSPADMQPGLDYLKFAGEDPSKLDLTKLLDSSFVDAAGK
jgi:ABC-type nitrate/sulfonate/bicarbonate transport system substrate-binding protein